VFDFITFYDKKERNLSSALMNNLILDLGLHEGAKLAIQTYVADHREEWDQELKTTKKVSLFIRHGTSGLPFSIEYWNDHVCLVYPKKRLDQSLTKKVTYAVDIDQNQVYARAKPIFPHQEKLEKKVELIDSLSGSREIVQNYRSSHYQDKHLECKFHNIQILYDGTLWSIQNKLSDQDLKMMVLDLFAGLAAIHKKGGNHCDLHQWNILYRKTDGIITGFVICDLADFQLSSEKESLVEVASLIHLLNAIFKNLKKALELFTDYF
jgi:hypothetical protein